MSFTGVDPNKVQDPIAQFLASEKGKLLETKWNNEWNNEYNSLEENFQKRKKDYDEQFRNRYARAQQEGETAEQLKERVDRKARQDEGSLKSHQENIEAKNKNKSIEINNKINNQIEVERRLLEDKENRERKERHNDAQRAAETKRNNHQDYLNLVNSRNGGGNKRVNTKKNKSKNNNTNKQKSKNRKTKRRTNK